MPGDGGHRCVNRQCGAGSRLEHSYSGIYVGWLDFDLRRGHPHIHTGRGVDTEQQHTEDL